MSRSLLEMSQEPKAVIFGAPVIPPLEHVSISGPTAINFPGAATPHSSPLPRLADSSTGPGALVFPDSTEHHARPAIKIATPVAQPTVLVFKEAAPAVLPKVPGKAFNELTHPLQSTVLARCAVANPDLFGDNESRLSRLVSQLLPVTLASIEDYGYRMLDHCKNNALQASAASNSYAALKVVETLKAAVAVAGASPGLIGKFKQQWLGTPQDHLARLAVLRPQLLDTIKHLREVLPKVKEDALRLALHVLALDSVLHISGVPAEPVLERTITQRQGLLHASLMQGRLVTAQIQLHEETAVLQMAECDRLQAVTLSASVLARSLGARS